VAPTLFDQPLAAEETNDSTAPAAEEEATEPQDAEVQLDYQATGDDSTESQPEPAPVVEEARPNRPDMRSMLFGEEPEPAAPVAPASEPASLYEATPEEAEVSAPVEETRSWSEPAEEAMAAEVAEAPAAEVVEAPVEDATEEPVAESVEVAEQPEAEAVPQYSEEPASVEESNAPVATEPDSAQAKGDGGVLVIIEDDQAAAEYYATLFRGNGYQVNVANDGVSGVDLCLKVQPQVILLDVMMPRQNGILVLQTLRASDETRNTPVVVMSNFSEPTLIKRALQLGALEYVIKTQVEGAALLNAVPRWMNREKAFAA
jgi:CheY-like chemotaxis protein